MNRKQLVLQKVFSEKQLILPGCQNKKQEIGMNDSDKDEVYETLDKKLLSFIDAFIDEDDD